MIYGAADTKSARWVDEHSDPRGSLEDRQNYVAESLKLARENRKPLQVNVPVSAHTEEDSYGEREYESGCAFLQELCAVMGEKKFSRFLRSCYRANRLKVSDTAGVLGAVRAQDNGKAVNRVIRRYVSSKYL